MLEWTIWGLLLIAQSATGVLTTRAKNTTDLWYSGITALLNYATFVVNLYIGTNILVEAKVSGNVWLAVGACVFYTDFSTLGAILMHWAAITHIERRFNGTS